MNQAKNLRIDPLAIQQQATTPRPRAAVAAKAAFGDYLPALAPLAAEGLYQSTGNPNAAAVLHSAFTSLPLAYGASRGAYAGAMLGDLPGAMGSTRYAGGLIGGGDYAGNVPGTEIPQAELIEQMNTNNLQLLELQAVMQNNMQQWTTKSNILKSVHEAKMALIQKFTVQG